jgi:transposase-like protein
MGARSNPPVELRPSTDRLERPASRRRILKAEKAKMVELYQAGLSAIEVAEAVGVAKSSVLQTLRSAGVPARPVGVHYAR